MTSPLTAAEAWCWVARMLSKEADFHYYAWPKTEEHMSAGYEADGNGTLAHERAKSLGADETTWKSAMRKWESG